MYRISSTNHGRWHDQHGTWFSMYEIWTFRHYFGILHVNSTFIGIQLGPPYDIHPYKHGTWHSPRIEPGPTNMETGTPCIETQPPSMEHILTSVGFVTLDLKPGISIIEICSSRKPNLPLPAWNLVLHM